MYCLAETKTEYSFHAYLALGGREFLKLNISNLLSFCTFFAPASCSLGLDHLRYTHTSVSSLNTSGISQCFRETIVVLGAHLFPDVGFKSKLETVQLLGERDIGDVWDNLLETIIEVYEFPYLSPFG